MDLVKKEDNFSITINEIENTRKMCEMLMRTPHYAKLGPDGVYAVVAKAKSLGIDPIDALNGALYYVNGRVGMSTEAMAARMRAAGHSIQKDIQKSATNCCVLIGKRADNGDQWVTSFSVEDAKRAGIYNEKGPWGKYPSVMCYNRAMSQMFRQLTPDLSKGAGYTLDELKEIAATESYSAHQPSPSVIESITEDQAQELEVLLSECHPDYSEKVWQTLKKPPISITTLSQLPVPLFERIKAAALKNRAEHWASLQEDEESNFDVEVLEA